MILFKDVWFTFTWLVYGASHMTFSMRQDSILSWRSLRICPNYFGRTWVLVCFLFALLPLFLCSSTGCWLCCFLFFFLLFFSWRTKGMDKVLAPEAVINYLLWVTLQLKTVGISALKSFEYSLNMCAMLVFPFLQQHYLLSLVRYHWGILVDMSFEKCWFSGWFPPWKILLVLFQLLSVNLFGNGRPWTGKCYQHCRYFGAFWILKIWLSCDFYCESLTNHLLFKVCCLDNRLFWVKQNAITSVDYLSY